MYTTPTPEPGNKKLVIVVSILAVLVFVPGIFIYSLLTNPEYKCEDCNLIMISLSNVSVEHMSLYGYERLTTPNIDKWAEDAIVFENAFTQASWTLPAATSLFTSLYPYTHRVFNRHFENVLDKNIETLPEILQDHGYKTAAFTGGLDYHNKFSHMRGFEYFEEAPINYLLARLSSDFDSTLKKSLGWLKKNSTEKFFLFLHGFNAHCPFNPPEGTRGTFSVTKERNLLYDQTCLRGFKNSDDGTYEVTYFSGGGVQTIALTRDDMQYLEDRYDEEILELDKVVGKFLNSLDKAVLDKTIIVIFSDHGEMFAKHGRFGRVGSARGTMYDDVLHIPLLIKIPKQKNKLVNSLVQTIDIMPTLLTMLGLPDSRHPAQGMDITPLLSGSEEYINEHTFAGSKFAENEEGVAWLMHPFRSLNESVRNREWKLIHEIQYSEGDKVREETYELYDLRSDLHELRNIVDSRPLIASKLKTVLENWRNEAVNSGFQDTVSPQVYPDALLEAAKKLGY